MRTTDASSVVVTAVAASGEDSTTEDTRSSIATARASSTSPRSPGRRVVVREDGFASLGDGISVCDRARRRPIVIVAEPHRPPLRGAHLRAPKRRRVYSAVTLNGERRDARTARSPSARTASVATWRVVARDAPSNVSAARRTCTALGAHWARRHARRGAPGLADAWRAIEGRRAHSIDWFPDGAARRSSASSRRRRGPIGRLRPALESDRAARPRRRLRRASHERRTPRPLASRSHPRAPPLAPLRRRRRAARRELRGRPRRDLRLHRPERRRQDDDHPRHGDAARADGRPRRDRRHRRHDRSRRRCAGASATCPITPASTSASPCASTSSSSPTPSACPSLGVVDAVIELTDLAQAPGPARRDDVEGHEAAPAARAHPAPRSRRCSSSTSRRAISIRARASRSAICCSSSARSARRSSSRRTSSPSSPTCAPRSGSSSAGASSSPGPSPEIARASRRCAPRKRSATRRRADRARTRRSRRAAPGVPRAADGAVERRRTRRPPPPTAALKVRVLGDPARPRYLVRGGPGIVTSRCSAASCTSTTRATT